MPTLMEERRKPQLDSLQLGAQATFEDGLSKEKLAKGWNFDLVTKQGKLALQRDGYEMDVLLDKATFKLEKGPNGSPTGNVIYLDHSRYLDGVEHSRKHTIAPNGQWSSTAAMITIRSTNGASTLRLDSRREETAASYDALVEFKAQGRQVIYTPEERGVYKFTVKSTDKELTIRQHRQGGELRHDLIENGKVVWSRKGELPATKAVDYILLHEIEIVPKK